MVQYESGWLICVQYGSITAVLHYISDVLVIPFPNHDITLCPSPHYSFTIFASTIFLITISLTTISLTMIFLTIISCTTIFLTTISLCTPPEITHRHALANFLLLRGIETLHCRKYKLMETRQDTCPWGFGNPTFWYGNPTVHDPHTRKKVKEIRQLFLLPGFWKSDRLYMPHGPYRSF